MNDAIRQAAERVVQGKAEILARRAAVEDRHSDFIIRTGQRLRVAEAIIALLFEQNKRRWFRKQPTKQQITQIGSALALTEWLLGDVGTLRAALKAIVAEYETSGHADDYALANRMLSLTKDGLRWRV